LVWGVKAVAHACDHVVEVVVGHVVDETNDLRRVARAHEAVEQLALVQWGMGNGEWAKS